MKLIKYASLMTSKDLYIFNEDQTGSDPMNAWSGWLTVALFYRGTFCTAIESNFRQKSGPGREFWYPSTTRNQRLVYRGLRKKRGDATTGRLWRELSQLHYKENAVLQKNLLDKKTCYIRLTQRKLFFMFSVINQTAPNIYHKIKLQIHNFGVTVFVITLRQ